MKKLYVAFFSLAALGMSTGQASAFGCFRGCCCCYKVCCKPYNAFTPFCCGTVCCHGCCPCQPTLAPCGGGPSYAAAGCEGCALGELPAAHGYAGADPVIPGYPGANPVIVGAPTAGTPNIAAPMPSSTIPAPKVVDPKPQSYYMPGQVPYVPAQFPVPRPVYFPHGVGHPNAGQPGYYAPQMPQTVPANMQAPYPMGGY